MKIASLRYFFKYLISSESYENFNIEYGNNVLNYYFIYNQLNKI